jgi:CHAT domain-containing protein/Tfp pilus assembly protein PilF
VIGALLLAAAVAATPVAQPLSADHVVRQSLAGGEKAYFTIEVAPETVAQLTVVQEGVDVGVTVRLAGSEYPKHGLDMVGGTAGVETRYVPISAAPATYNVTISTAEPHAVRGDFTISMSLRPADDALRAIVAARELYHAASETGWSGDGASFEKAQAMYEQAGNDALAAGDRELAAEAIYQCARLHDNLGDLPGAIERQKRALKLFQDLGRNDREARVLNRLGDYHRKTGQVTLSEEYFAQALPLARETKDRFNEADILNNSGILMLAVGKLEEGLDELQAAVPLAQDLGTANVEAALWNNIAGAYTQLGMNDKAVEAGQRGVAVVRGSNLPIRRLARSLTNLAEAYFAHGDDARADAAIREALEIHTRTKDQLYLADALTFLGDMQRAHGEYDHAADSYATALPGYRNTNSRRGQALLLSKWGALEINRGNVIEALAKLDEGLSFARDAEAQDVEARLLYDRARALENAGRIDDASASIQSAIDIIETMRGQIARSDLRSSWVAQVRAYYDLAIELLLKQGKTTAAFAMNERSRARALLESLAESGTKIRKGVDPEMLRTEQQLQAELNARDTYRAQLIQRDGEDSPQAVALTRELATLLERWKQVEAQIRATSRAYAALKMPQPIDAARVQSTLLGPSTILVEYHLAPTGSSAWVIDRKSITIHSLPDAKKIDELARRYHQLLSRDSESMTEAQRGSLAKEIAAAGRAVAQAVWKPIAARVGVSKRVLIVADGALQYVPFAALPAPEPLITKHEIVYLPSASVLNTIRETSRPVTSTAVAVFADPVFSADDVRVVGGSVAMASLVRGPEVPYQRLRFSRKEADAISSLTNRTMKAVDFQASKANVTTSDLKRYRILHFATHGSINTERPELSRLVLSMVDRNGKPIDGFLHLHEIYNLDLDADLVVLSACRTALGKEVHGEGLIGLTRGFMYAGASRVVATTWNVDDRASALLMSRFYSEMLAKKVAPAAALRAAQLSLLREARWTNPHYWAAFALQGEWK